MSFDEFRDYYRLNLGRTNTDPSPLVHSAPLDASALPASVDWVAKGAVTPVKDQG